MEGVAHANYQGIERNLKQKPADDATWTFMRGQALLVAESGNLLMIRPPKSDGQTVWMQRASDMRDAATTLAKHAANRDYERSKAALGDVTNTCNRCHQTFRVPVQIGAPPQPEKGAVASRTVIRSDVVSCQFIGAMTLRRSVLR